MVKLRETLEAEAGIPDLEADLVDPALPGFAKRAAEIFHRDGFCLVKVSAQTHEARVVLTRLTLTGSLRPVRLIVRTH